MKKSLIPLSDEHRAIAKSLSDKNQIADGIRVALDKCNTNRTRCHADGTVSYYNPIDDLYCEHVRNVPYSAWIVLESRDRRMIANHLASHE